MKQHFLTRAVSFFLSLSMLIQLLPMQRLSVFAEEAEEESSYSETEASVAGEVTSRREVDTKHFRLSDGSFIAVAYGTPVHYQDEDGSWEDIDNTVVRDPDSGSYQLNRPDVQVSIPEDLSQGTLLESSMEDVSVSMSVLDTAGALQLTENRQVQAQDQALTAVPEAPVLSPGEAITYDREAQLNILEETATLALQEDQEDPLEAAIEPQKLRSAWVYEEAFPDVDLRYTAHGNSIKEEILVKEPQAAYRYDFLLTLEGLEAEQNPDGSVSLVDGEDTLRYQIPAPVMTDANGAVSYDVAYVLRDTAQGAVLTVIADPNWINGSDRAFPVSIDPTLKLENQIPYDCVHSNYVMRAAPNSATAGRVEMLVGGNSPNDKFRLFLYFRGLPEIPENCEITSASLKLAMPNYTYSGLGKFPVAVYDVTSEKPSTFATYRAWLESFTWNTQPSFNTSDLIDCQVVEAKPANHEWDMTRLVKRWYAEEDPNTIIAMTMLKENVLKANTNFAVAHFQAYDPMSGNAGPKFIVKYRSTTGIEPYYSYESLGAGAAGTAYISHATGQLKAAKELIGYSSTTNPYSFGLAYNSEDADDTQVPPAALGYAMELGTGWRLSCQQVVRKGSAPTNYLEYHDGDGTVHYFKKSGDYYYDEDGLGLKIQSKGGGTYDMTDLQGNKWTFTNYFLTEMTDDDGNQILINIDTTTNQINSIQQKNARVEDDAITIAEFAYSGQRVTSITDAADNAYTLSYTGDKLTGISKGTTALAKYGYSGNRLARLLDVESGYCLEFEWNSEGKVTSWKEIADCIVGSDNLINTTGIFGANAQLTYEGNSRTRCRDAGKNRTINDSDDILTWYLFDEARRTVNAYSTDVSGKILGATNAVYNDGDSAVKKNNKLDHTSTIGIAARQLLRNSGFEISTDTSWTGGTMDTTKYRTGLQSRKGSITGNGVVLSQMVTGLTAGEEYTFSGYVNTADVTFSNDSAKIDLSVIGASGITQPCIDLKYRTADGTGTEELEWVRLSVTFIAGSGSHTVSLVSEGCTGTLYADDFQLEEGDAPSRHNLVENGSMELLTGDENSTERALVGWTGADGAEPTQDATKGAVNTASSLKLEGNPEEDYGAWQDIPVNLLGSHSYVLSGWAYTNACADNKNTAADRAKDKHKQCGLRAVVYYESDGKDTTADTEYFYVPFETQVREQWQFASVAVVPKQPKRPVTKIRISCAFEKNANTCWYDNISLVREASQTMTYDDDGNLQSVTTSGLSEDKSTYKNGNLIKTITGGYGTFEYTYDSTHKHRLTSVTNSKLKQAMTYDSFGNVIGTTLSQAEGTGKILQTSATYDTTGNLLTSVTDASGATVEYAYGDSDSVMNGLPTTVTAPNGVETNTVYDKNGRVTATGIDNLAALYYTYSKGDLTTVTRHEQENYYQHYQFTYDDFGNMLSAAVGNNPLATYSYGPNNGPLLTQTYGNGDVLTFTYDDLGRVETVTQDNGTVLTYHYNGEGTLHSIVETKGTETRTYLYQYDTLGRLLSCQRLDGDQSVIRTWQHFNEHNQVDKTVWQTANGTYFENYIYDSDDGSLTTIIGSDGHRQALYYDTLSRLAMRTLAGDTSLTERYIYLDGTGNTTTTQVKQKQIYGGPLEVFFEYAYDGSGNIQEEKTTIQGDTKVTTYTYDSQNQLIRENNQAAGKTWVWTYDSVGNILSRKEYAYTTETPGTALDTVNYGYSNTQWQDLLTNYGGKPIAYDGSGNITSIGRSGTDYYCIFAWENGRQLESLSQSGAQVTFSYDGSGLRTEKTVTGGGTTQTYSYIYSGNTLMEMGLSQNTNDGSSTEKRLYFTYDSNGNPATVLTDDGEIYYYVTNLQGDVISILNSSRMPVVQYTYNAWGQAMEVTGSMASTLGQLNPLRYRGYVYDAETGLYYLQSRYYDPEVGRFINADAFASTGQEILSYNMFAYCGNNPNIRKDTNGHRYCAATTVSGESVYDRFISCDYQNELLIEKYHPELKVKARKSPEQIVLDADFLTTYKDTLVWKFGDSTAAFSCGIIFMGRGVQDPNLVRHEYGHVEQLKRLGVGDYFGLIVAPSVTCFVLTESSYLPRSVYYSLPWEYKANEFGLASGNYTDWAKNVSNAYWIFAEIVSALT